MYAQQGIFKLPALKQEIVQLVGSGYPNAFEKKYIVSIEPLSPACQALQATASWPVGQIEILS